MRFLRRHSVWVWLAVVIASGTFLNACTSWHTTSLAPERFNRTNSPADVRLTLNDGSKLRAGHPVLTQDSLVWLEPATQ